MRGCKTKMASPAWWTQIAWTIGVTTAWASICPAYGISQEPHTNATEEAKRLPRAAILVVGDEQEDPFTAAYSYEVTASFLRSKGFAPVPYPRSSRALAKHSDQNCAETPACLFEIAVALRAPTLLVVAPHRTRGRTIEINVVAYHALQTLEQTAELTISGDEAKIMELIEQLGPKLDAARTPCMVATTSSLEKLIVHVGARAIDSRIHFFPAGTHRIEAIAPQRSPWSGTLVCRPGKMHQIAVR